MLVVDMEFKKARKTFIIEEREFYRNGNRLQWCWVDGTFASLASIGITPRRERFARTPARCWRADGRKGADGTEGTSFGTRTERKKKRRAVRDRGGEDA